MKKQSVKVSDNKKTLNYFTYSRTSIFNPAGYAKWSIDCFIIGVLCFATWFATAAIIGCLTLDLPEKLFASHISETLTLPAVVLTVLICPTVAVFYMIKYVAPKFFEQKVVKFLMWVITILFALLGAVVLYRYLLAHII